MDIFCAFTKLSTATEIAKSISSARTYSRKAIRALASAIRIMLSKCRTVIGKEPVASDSRRRSAKSRASFSESISYSFGRTLSRAYTMYLRRRSCGINCRCVGRSRLLVGGEAHLGVERRADVHLVPRRIKLGMTPQMATNDEARE
jgi:hypothetical protein